VGLGVNLRGIQNALQRPLPSMYEDWQSLAAANWGITNPATGIAWAVVISAGSGGNVYCEAAPNASETARLKSVGKYMIGLPDVSFIRRKLVLEFEAKIANPGSLAPTHMDGANSWLGMVDSAGGSIGFTVVGGVLNATGSTTVALPTAALWGGIQSLWVQNKYRIEISNWKNEFFVNDQRVAVLQHADAETCFRGSIDFKVVALPAGPLEIDIGMVRLWYKDVA
jgi:hypothetical protein